ARLTRVAAALPAARYPRRLRSHRFRAMPSHPRDRVTSLLELAGVRVDGPAPTDLRVHDARLYARVVAHGSLGLGEAYMDGWWDADDLPGFLCRLLAARLDEKVGGIDDAWLFLKSRIANLQRGRRAYEVGE